MRPHGRAAELERRHRLTIDLLEKVFSTTEVADRVGADLSSVRRWRQAHRRQGDPGLNAKPHPGHPSRLTKRQKTLLRNRLLNGAKANGFSTDLWTCPRLVQVIEQQYGVQYHVDHIPRRLASRGCSCQKPQKKAIERDEEATSRWIREDWTRIRKSRP